MSDETSISIKGPIKILLIEDNPRMQESLRNGLQGIDSNLQFVAETGNGKKAFEILRATKIDLVIMDYELEKESRWGAELTKDIIKQFTDIKIIFWSVNTRPVDVEKAKAAGAHGYIPKESTDIQIKVAIDKVMDDEEVWLDTNPRLKLTKPELAPKEREVMRQLAKGKSNQQIAIVLLREEFLDSTKNEVGFADKYKNKTIDEYMDEIPDKAEFTRFESRTKTVERHLVNIKTKYNNGLSRGKLIKEAIKEYSELEDKRDIPPEEIAVLEFLHYAIKPELIAEALAISERDVEKIKKKFNPEDISKLF